MLSATDMTSESILVSFPIVYIDLEYMGHIPSYV